MGAVLLTAAILVVVAGCGGTDSTAAINSPSKSSGITKAELIKRGDAICRKTDTVQKEAFAAYNEKHGEATTSKELEKALVKSALPPIEAEIEELAALGAPRGDELQINAIVAGFEKALKGAEKHPDTLLGTDEGEFAQPDKRAGTYGFKDCSKAL